MINERNKIIMADNNRQITGGMLDLVINENDKSSNIKVNVNIKTLGGHKGYFFKELNNLYNSFEWKEAKCSHSRKIKFSDDTKTYDDTCEQSMKLIRFLNDFVSGRIKSDKDILLNHSHNREINNFFIEEVSLIIEKLQDIQNCPPQPMAKDPNKEEEFDDYWDQEMFTRASASKSVMGLTVPIMRTGSRERIASRAFPVGYLPYLKRLFDLLKTVDELLFLNYA
jgi:hypothetical protein